MGQYWKPVVEKDGVKYSISSHDFGNGLKIMEHSYIGNELPSIMMYELYDTPAHLTWVGDYTDERHVGRDQNSPTGKELWKDKDIVYFTNANSVPDYMKSYREEEKRKTKEIPDDLLKEILSNFDKYSIRKYSLVNHTLKEYVDMAQYMDHPKDSKSYSLNDDYVIHPLPLLVSSPSMDEGGGDYHKSAATCYDKVGSWSWDKISVMNTENVPKDFKKLDIYFDEIKRS